ncbi:nucleotidyltransferase family protein [Bacillus cereus group sp. BY9-3LC]|uniref:nucleotidyltransferase domain-containing protein n=1 Tax=Bacillus cereus group sp. BY9-3LC TaxID=3018075 RepID=UPI0022E959AA|nr:nucleotidyltransferase family protein [Bacillus cereus group sp. BY9-3LC]MDA1778502.1 nucleotidyltransferase family protein [Bacillus cereus group sp. BY9-3LC]
MNNSYGLDLNGVAKELKLQLEILKNGNDTELQEINKECFENIDWDRFLELTIHHRVYAFIYPKMKEMDKKLVPERIIQILHQYFKMNTFQMLHLSAEMELVNKLFTENEIRALFLKGPLLAHDLYGDISLRTSSDLDILIPIHQLKKAEKILLEQGYVKDGDIQTILNDWKWRHHHMEFFHPQKQIKIEIHWRLHPGPGKEPRFEELWERKRTSTLTSYPIYLLGSEDLFLFLISHGARHGWSRLRWLLDINQMVKQGLDWKEVYKLFTTYQCGHVGGQALILATELLNATISEEMKVLADQRRSRKLAQDALFYIRKMINLHTDPVPDEVSAYHSRHLFSLMSNQQKILFIISYFYPYPIDAKTLPLPKYLHFLYFPLRPILCTWRKARKHVLS